MVHHRCHGHEDGSGEIRLLQILMWEPRSLMLVLLITIPVLSQQTTEVGAGVTMGKASWDEITPLMWVMETALLIMASLSDIAIGADDPKIVKILINNNAGTTSAQTEAGGPDGKMAG